MLEPEAILGKCYLVSAMRNSPEGPMNLLKILLQPLEQVGDRFAPLGTALSKGLVGSYKMLTPSFPSSPPSFLMSPVSHLLCVDKAGLGPNPLPSFPMFWYFRCIP